jgi:hypothetical protein
MDSDSRDSSAPPNNMVVEFRLKNGLCHSCGARIYEIGEAGRVTPLTIPCVALEGRCLFCYPDNNDQRDEELVRRKRRRRSPNEEPEPASSSFSVVKAEPFDGVHASPHVHASPPAARFASLPRAGNGRVGVVEVCAARASNNAVEDEINMEITIQDADHNKFVGVVTEGTRKKGRGIFRYTHIEGEIQGEESVYDGEFESGRMEGQGTIKDPATGCVYEGSFHRGAAHGYGVCTWLQGGWKYEGEWVRDKREGKGRLSQEEAEDGEVYEGEWKNDQWHGKGELKFNGGGRYVGDFKNHKLEGQGRVRQFCNVRLVFCIRGWS